VARHDGGEGIEFEEEIGVASSDHFVIDEFLTGTEMAFEAPFGAGDDVARVRHMQLDGFGVFLGRVFGGVLAEPALGGAVAAFAAYAFGDFVGTAAQLGRRSQSVAGEALLRFFGFGAEFEDASHALADIASEGLVGAAVLILENPGGVFVLQDAAVGDGLDAAMATGGGTRTRTNVFAWFILGLSRRQRPEAKNAEECNQGSGLGEVSH